MACPFVRDALRATLITVPLIAAECTVLEPSVKARAQDIHRDFVAQPFSDESIWNTPLGQGAVFQDDSAPETASLHSENVGGHATSYAWVAANAFGLYHQKASDPEITWTYDARSPTTPWPHRGPVTNGRFVLRTPVDIKFSEVDGLAVVITDDGRSAYEVFLGRRDRVHSTYHARYIVYTDLRGPGIASADGRSEGIRAAGVSLLGGLVRCVELNQGRIAHAIAMALSPTQMRKGATMDEQKVWPATATDQGGKNEYSGTVPMGALIGIPPTVDLERLGLSSVGLTLARAYQQYGGYVVDTAHNTMILAMIECGCQSEQMRLLQADKRKIMPYLKMVINNGPNHVGGPGDRIIKR